MIQLTKEQQKLIEEAAKRGNIDPKEALKEVIKAGLWVYGVEA